MDKLLQRVYESKSQSLAKSNRNWRKWSWVILLGLHRITSQSCSSYCVHVLLSPCCTTLSRWQGADSAGEDMVVESERCLEQGRFVGCGSVWAGWRSNWVWLLLKGSSQPFIGLSAPPTPKEMSPSKPSVVRWWGHPFGRLTKNKVQAVSTRHVGAVRKALMNSKTGLGICLMTLCVQINDVTFPSTLNSF